MRKSRGRLSALGWRALGRVAALLVTGLIWINGSLAAELVMFEQESCPWCQAWDEEVGVIYHKTDEGRRAPLRRVDFDGRRPADLAQIGPIVYSPTFVLLDQGREVGRIAGYPGEDHFWGLLGELLAQLPPAAGS